MNQEAISLDFHKMRLFLKFDHGNGSALYLCRRFMRDGIDERIKVEGRQIWVLCLDEDNVWRVIPEENRYIESTYSSLTACSNPSLIFQQTTEHNHKDRCPTNFRIDVVCHISR